MHKEDRLAQIEPPFGRAEVAPRLRLANANPAKSVQTEICSQETIATSLPEIQTSSSCVPIFLFVGVFKLTLWVVDKIRGSDDS
jgi:hypothetical protein